MVHSFGEFFVEIMGPFSLEKLAENPLKQTNSTIFKATLDQNPLRENSALTIDFG